MQIKSIKQIKNLKNKTVLMRCDFDVPIKNGKITDNTRLENLIPTINFLITKNVKQIIMLGHLGRPDGKVVKKLSLEPVAKRLSQLLKKSEIKFIKNNWNSNQQLKIGEQQLIMLENVRFSDREEKNCQRFAKKLAQLGDIYVNECFSTSHRAHSSISAIQKYLPSYAGLHLTQEIEHLNLNKAQKPITLIIGGAKIETKLPVIEKFINRADYILVGGAVANTFFKAQGHETGKSLVDSKYIKDAQKIIKALKQKNIKAKLLLPVDIVNQKAKTNTIEQIKKTDKILDIGSQTTKQFCDIIKASQTIIWNGPLGFCEDKKFAVATNKIVTYILKNKRAQIIIGGGETEHALGDKKLPANIFVSSGGGAMLEYLGGKKLPGLINLKK